MKHYNSAVKNPPTVLYIFCGILALASAAIVFLPVVTESGNAKNIFTVAFDGYGIGVSAISNGAVDIGGISKTVAISVAGALALQIALQIVWAILSFARKRPAGVFGIISSILFLALSLLTMSTVGYFAKPLDDVDATGVAYVMAALAFLGFVLSVIQLVKKKYL